MQIIRVMIELDLLRSILISLTTTSTLSKAQNLYGKVFEDKDYKTMWAFDKITYWAILAYFNTIRGLVGQTSQC